MWHKLCLTLFIGVSLFTTSLADVLSKTIHFSTTDISIEKTTLKDHTTDYDIVRLKNCELTDKVGEPQLPVYIARIVLPYGSTIKEVGAKSLAHKDLPGKYYIYPAQPPQILSLSSKKDIVFIPPNDSIYNSDSLYPSKLIKFVDTGYLSGYQIASFLIYPIQYIPKDGKLRLHTKIKLMIRFEQSKAAYPLKAKCRSPRSQKVYEDLVRSLVLNPDDVKSSLYEPVPPNGYEYVIITHGSLVDALKPLAHWNTKRGIPTAIRTTEWIYSNFDGGDEAECIRNFLRLAYADSGLVWALLGGDVDIVPARVAFAMDCEAGYPGENDLRCDLYYADLDGSWDANGNGIYGEIADEVDLYPDIFVGRAPINTISDANTFVSKVLTYEKGPPQYYLLKMLFCAEVLWHNPYTDAGIGKDMIEEESVPSQFDITKLYQSMGNENTSSVLQAMNSGHHIINHDGHGWINVMGMGTGYIDNNDVDNLNNGPNYSILFSIGCWTNAFHYDCIGEHFINNPNGGCVAYIGNASYGWGSPGNPGYGYSDRFDSRFYHSLFLDHNYEIGKTLAEAKAYYAALSREENVYRWHQYELNLLGDPTMDIWTDIPDSLSVTFPDSICEGLSLFTIKVQNQAKHPIDHALVCIMKDPDVYEYGYTDSQGEAKFTISTSPGDLLVTVTAHNFYPYEGVSKVFAVGPYISYYSHMINDTLGGNGDGLVNPGEIIKLNVLLKNFGNVSANNVTAILRTNDTLVSITDSLEDFGNISPGDTAWSLGEFSFKVDRFCINGHTINFDLEIKSNTKYLWHSFFGITVATPVLAYLSYSINDSTGNNDGIAEPGETISILVSIKNQGLCEATGVDATLSTSDPYITINLGDISCGNILQDSICVAPYNATISSLCPSPYFAPLTLRTTTQNGYSFTYNFMLTVGQPGFFDDMESEAIGWTHGGVKDSWILTQHMAHTFSHSWYCGNPNVWHYENNMNCWLLSPKFVLAPNSWLSFWTWYDVTTYGVDGLYVEIGDGTNWDTLDFIGSGGALDSLYDIESNRRNHQYNLFHFAHGCTLQVRFSFVSDASDTAEGFYLDDVRIGPYIAEPSLHRLSLNIIDSLYNDNGVIDPGEKVDMILSIINDGMIEAKYVMGILKTDDPYLHVLNDSAYFGDISPKSIGNNTETPFCLFCDTITPYRHRATLSLYLSANDNTYHNTSAFTIEVGCGIIGKDLGNDWRKYSYNLSRYFYTGIATELNKTSNSIIFQCYPNPTNTRIKVEYSLPFKSSVKLSIYNVVGQLIRRLVNGIQTADYHIISWDGKDNTGKPVEAGIYFCQLITQPIDAVLAHKSVYVKKIVILR